MCKFTDIQKLNTIQNKKWIKEEIIMDIGKII